VAEPSSEREEQKVERNFQHKAAYVAFSFIG